MRSKTFICLLGIFNFSIGIERPIKVIITSYNNKEYCDKNLKAVFNQKYSNYKVYYCNDASTDNTLNLVKNYIKINHLEDKCILIANNRRQGKMANFHYIMSLCDETDIIVIYDGDDWFAHDRVLERINKEYEDSNVWATYGSYEDSDSGIGFFNARYPKLVTVQRSKDIILAGNYRKAVGFEICKCTPGHPFTFYAWLYKKIKEEDFKYKGEFVSMAPDGAILWPIIEMARFHLRFIPDLLYIYNNSNPLAEVVSNGNLQHEIINFLILKESYQNLDPNFDKLRLLNDVFVITEDLNMDVANIVQKFINKRSQEDDLGQIIICHADNKNQIKFKKQYPSCLFINYSYSEDYSFFLNTDELTMPLYKKAVQRFDCNGNFMGVYALLALNMTLGASDFCYYLDLRKKKICDFDNCYFDKKDVFQQFERA